MPLDQHPPATYRRAVYHQTARAARVDVLSDFDCPDPALAVARRPTTTTPLQALVMMNHSFTHDMAALLAQRIQRDTAGQTAGLPAAEAQRRQAEYAFVLVLNRPPTDDELAAVLPAVGEHGLLPLCYALLNCNELIFLR